MEETKQLAFYFDLTRCHGCQTCLVACKDWNGVTPGPAFWRDLHDFEVGEYPSKANNWAPFEVYMTTYSCMHCDNPACIDACAHQAIYKRSSDGVVIINRDKCQGLGACIKACPYSAPQIPDDGQETPALPLSTFTKGHKAMKCGFCLDRIYDNTHAYPLKPACVGSCLMRAIDFGTVQEIKDKYPDAVRISNGVSVNDRGTVKHIYPPDNKGNDGRMLAKRTGPNFFVKLRNTNERLG